MMMTTEQAFSENGALLASVGQDDNHCLAVHDWEKGRLQHTGPTDTRAVRKTGLLHLVFKCCFCCFGSSRLVPVVAQFSRVCM